LFYGVGLMSILLSRQNQRLGDLVAGTLVVYQEAVKTETLVIDLPDRESAATLFNPAQLAMVPPKALALAADFLRVRGELAPRPRQELAGELSELVRHVSGLEPLSAQSAESFLWALIIQAEQTVARSDQVRQQV